jgi:hypothetical protein
MKTVSNITFDTLTLLSKNSFVAVESAWERKRLGFWDCHGEIVGNEPIVAVSIMRIGNRVEWARSGKGSTTKLDVRLLLGMYDSNPKDVQVTFFIGGNGPRWRTLLDDPEQPPEIFIHKKIAIGTPFAFCKPFGNPAIELFGLILLREQVIGARNGLWHVKKVYRDSLPDGRLQILTFGRSGFFETKSSAVGATSL